MRHGLLLCRIEGRKLTRCCCCCSRRVLIMLCETRRCKETFIDLIELFFRAFIGCVDVYTLWRCEQRFLLVKPKKKTGNKILTKSTSLRGLKRWIFKGNEESLLGFGIQKIETFRLTSFYFALTVFFFFVLFCMCVSAWTSIFGQFQSIWAFENAKVEGAKANIEKRRKKFCSSMLKNMK